MDKSGNVIGRSRKKKNFWGDEYVEHENIQEEKMKREEADRAALSNVVSFAWLIPLVLLGLLIRYLSSEGQMVFKISRIVVGAALTPVAMVIALLRFPGAKFSDLGQRLRKRGMIAMLVLGLWGQVFFLLYTGWSGDVESSLWSFIVYMIGYSAVVPYALFCGIQSRNALKNGCTDADVVTFDSLFKMGRFVFGFSMFMAEYAPVYLTSVFDDLWSAITLGLILPVVTYGIVRLISRTLTLPYRWISGMKKR